MINLALLPPTLSKGPSSYYREIGKLSPNSPSLYDFEFEAVNDRYLLGGRRGEATVFQKQSQPDTWADVRTTTVS